MQQCLIHRRVASSQHIDRNEISLCHELGTPYRIISPNDWRMETDLFAKVAFRASPREVTGILDYLTGQLYKNGDSEIEIGFIYDTTSQLLLNVAKDSKSSNLSRAFKLSLMHCLEGDCKTALSEFLTQLVTDRTSTISVTMSTGPEFVRRQGQVYLHTHPDVLFQRLEQLVDKINPPNHLPITWTFLFSEVLCSIFPSRDDYLSANKINHQYPKLTIPVYKIRSTFGTTTFYGSRTIEQFRMNDAFDAFGLRITEALMPIIYSCVLDNEPVLKRLPGIISIPIAENKINDALALLTHQELSQLIKITFNTPKIVEGLKDAISAAIDDANHHLKTGGGEIQFSPSGKYFTDHQRRNLILDKLTTALIWPKPPSILEKKTN